MQSNFNGITLWSAAKQLNTEISALTKDLLDSFSRLNTTGLLTTIQNTFDDKIDIHAISNGTSKLNLSHLFGLMIYYECTIQLAHISKLIHSHPRHTNDHRHFSVLELFQRQNQNKKHKICHKILNHITRQCNTPQQPILLYYGDTTNAIHINTIAIRNDKIWTQCKFNKCNKQSSLSSSVPKPSKPKPKHKSIHLPKKILPPYYDKNYHVLGRQHHLPLLSLTEIAKHNTKESCWIIINGLVLDVTAFLSYHPASAKSIVKNGGQCCDRHFKFHSKGTQKLMMKFVIGRIEKESACLIQ